MSMTRSGPALAEGVGASVGFEAFADADEEEPGEGEGGGHPEAVADDQHHAEGRASQGDRAEQDDERGEGLGTSPPAMPMPMRPTFPRRRLVFGTGARTGAGAGGVSVWAAGCAGASVATEATEATETDLLAWGVPTVRRVRRTVVGCQTDVQL
ncbi:hypothetical protein OTB20_17965 [Streptomyces sp. H27-H1]|uniref:hypothetical protein n=1 Tax=Streptomyces sp. H27-H1 TaxID=2996461 RepID=UPI002271AC63|nr:hypothetical protein [Streptomyces sp. H27-H1]MCY0928045.1 hypothetical protein [Streptomyces sp. H27-H1]